MANHTICSRFGLADGQFFAEQRLRNQHWFLGGVKIGFGDLTAADILRICDLLKDEEEFTCFNEHHFNQHANRTNATCVIKHNVIEFLEAERRGRTTEFP